LLQTICCFYFKIYLNVFKLIFAPYKSEYYDDKGKEDGRDVQHAWKRGEMHAHFVLGKSDRMRLLAISKLKLENNIKMDLKEVGWVGLF